MKSKYSIHKDRILEIYKSDPYLGPTAIIRKIHKEIKYKGRIMKAFRDYVSYVISEVPVKYNKVKVSTKSVSKSNNYKNTKFVLSAWNKKGYMMDINEYCEHYKLPIDDITSYKLVSHTGTPFYNIVFKTKEVFRKDLTEEYINKAVEKFVIPVKLKKIKPHKSNYTLRFIITDAHIAMETNADGFGLYGGVWNEKELFARGDVMIQKIIDSIILYKTFDEIHIIDLGDYMDGWDAMTVRKGHELPQNMDNEKAFDVGVSFKVKLIQNIIMLGVCNKIRVFNICNDNHSGSFGYVVNSAVKKIINAMFDDVVEVTNFRKFINHYNYGKHCFILSHGKDDKNLKFGFKPFLDKKGEDKINEYIEVNSLYDSFITFEKGDSHQQLFDQTTSDRFNYNNYMALSPASEWVQTNFKRGRSGFSLQVLTKNEKEITQIPYEFTWVKK